MQIFSVFEPSGVSADDSAKLSDPGRGVIFVKEGFCWPALLFPLVWVLYHRMWRIAGLYLLLSIGIGAMSGLLGAQHPAAMALALGFALIAAFEANRIRCLELERRGYQQVASVAADDLAKAEQRYFGERLQAHPVAPTPAPQAILRAPNTGWGFLTPDAR